MSTADASGRDVFTISRLNSEVRAVLDSSFPLLWVEGEISNLSTPRSGHLYFSLKDAHAQVRCALFRAKRQRLRFQPADGVQVLARVRIGFYEPRGDFQLIVEHLEPAGAGAAQREFERLKQRLQGEGLFDPARKRPLPTFPSRLGVITSPSGAAIRDVLKVLRRRAPQLAVTIFPVRVQGSGAAEEILEALRIATQRGDCDVLLLTRGGGSIEDLAAFNDERLARAVAAVDIPVVSAVGHEIDFAITDFVADRRAPTPSAAAELISPDTAVLKLKIGGQHNRLYQAMRRRLQSDRRELHRLEGRLRRGSPHSRLRQQQQRLDELDLRLLRALRTSLRMREHALGRAMLALRSHSPATRLRLLRQRYSDLSERMQQAWNQAGRQRSDLLTAMMRQLNAVSPLATMQRGYAVLRRPASGEVVSSVSQVSRGEQLEALLSDGRIKLQVEQAIPGDAPPAGS